MTIEERIEKFTTSWGLWPDGIPNRAFKKELHNLLEQVAEAQRELCYESHWDMSCSYPDAQFEEDNIRDAIIDAPSPLKDITIKQP